MLAMLDTLKVAKELKAAGFTEPQAEALVATLNDVQSGLLADVATKSDIAALRGEIGSIRGEIDRLDGSLRLEIDQVRKDLGAEIQQVRKDLGAEIQKVGNESSAESQQIRADIRGVRDESNVNLARVHAELNRQIGDLKWQIALLVIGASGLTVTLVKLIP